MFFLTRKRLCLCVCGTFWKRVAIKKKTNQATRNVVPHSSRFWSFPVYFFIPWLGHSIEFFKQFPTDFLVSIHSINRPNIPSIGIQFHFNNHHCCCCWKMNAIFQQRGQWWSVNRSKVTGFFLTTYRVFFFIAGGGCCVPDIFVMRLSWMRLEISPSFAVLFFYRFDRMDRISL